MNIPIIPRALKIRRLTLGIAVSALFLTGLTAGFAQTTVKTLGGGVGSLRYGYKDGNTFSNALFHTPTGLALDEYYNYLYVADRDNNAIRVVDLGLGVTSTFVPTNLTVKPVGVAVDSEGNVFVLNRGNTNVNSRICNILEFDTYGNLIATNAGPLTNAASIALDAIGNLYVTVVSNTLLKIAPNGTKTVVATITNTGTSLQGIIVKHNGFIAACDAGRHGVYLIDPSTGAITTNSGFNGVGDGTGNNNHGVLRTSAKFNQPTGVAETGDGNLIITDSGNHKVKLIGPTIVTNLFGVTSNYWTGTTPGWLDSTVKVPEYSLPNVQSRLPSGVVFASDGTIYDTERYYHLVRKATGTGLPLPPPLPPPVPAPTIGWVDFQGNNLTGFFSVLHPVTTYVANNDIVIAIRAGDTNGSQTFYTTGSKPAVGDIADPSPSNGSSAPFYDDGLDFNSVQSLPINISGDVIIKAIGTKNDGSPSSQITRAEFFFIVANPLIIGNNAAKFTVSDATSNSFVYYTTDGSNPKTNANAFVKPLTISGTNSSVYTATLNYPSNNFLFKAFARRANYQDSGVVSNYFSAANFNPNHMSFGLTNGEPSSSFIARPGQFYYAPVTLQLQPSGETMYSLQFNIAVTNGLSNPNKINSSSGINFYSMLMAPVPPEDGLYYPPAAGQWFLPIPPLIVLDTKSPPISIPFLNTNNNLLGVGWLFRTGYKYHLTDTNGRTVLDFNPQTQDLITYSIIHDTLFNKSVGTIVLGAFSFLIPNTASVGDKYYMQLGSASATRDGVGAPGSDVFIQPPADSTAVTVGSPAYVVGDVAPFRWLNAGDFGEGMLLNDDVMQVFQSAVLGTDMPPTNSDLFMAMDSSGFLGSWDSANNYFTNSGTLTPNTAQTMFDGNDQTINTNAFGDGVLDIDDVYVTFRRSLSPSRTGLNWLQRYWTNGQFVAVNVPNLSSNNLVAKTALTSSVTITTKVVTADTSTYQQSSAQFTAGDAIGSAGQTVQIPISVKVLGNYPLRLLGLNLTVHPLDNAPALTQPVQFTLASNPLGQPKLTAAKSAANFSAAWWPDNGISSSAGISTNAILGTLTVTIPATATANSAYAVHFDNLSSSPNGIALLPKQTYTGLVTLSARTNSSYGDGIPDAWRLRWFGTVNNYLSSSNACPTGDGISNWKKFVAGVNPNVAGNFPSVNPKVKTNAGYTSTIHWPTVSGKQYVIERSTDLFNGWSTISTNTGTGGDVEFNDTNTAKVKFYRVRILP